MEETQKQNNSDEVDRMARIRAELYRLRDTAPGRAKALAGKLKAKLATAGAKSREQAAKLYANATAQAERIGAEAPHIYARARERSAAEAKRLGAQQPAVKLWIAACGLLIISLLTLGLWTTLAALPFALAVLLGTVGLLIHLREPLSIRRLDDMAERLEASLEAIKDLQWEVREGEARYRDLLDHQDTVILRRDATGRLTFVNDAFCRTFGLERETALGQSFQPVPVGGSASGALPLAEGEERRGATWSSF